MKLKDLALTPINWVRAHWVLTLIIVLVVGGGGLWYYQSQQANNEPLIFIQPEVKDIQKTLDISAQVDAREKARMRFIAGGKVVFVGAQAGDTVKKYQTLATIDQASLRKQLDQDLNLYMKERLNWEDTVDDNKDDALNTTQRRLQDRDQLDLNNTVLSVEIRDIAIRNTALTAPFAGIVTVAPTAVPGVQLLASDYYEVVNPQSIYVVAEVDEADIGTVQVGQQARLTLDAFPDTTLTATVQKIAFTSSQSANGTVFKVEFLLDTGELQSKLRLGMNGDLSVVLAERTQVVTVPVIATIEKDDQIFVQVKTSETTAEERPITVGLETDEYFEVLSGVTPDDLIVSPE